MKPFYLLIAFALAACGQPASHVADDSAPVEAAANTTAGCSAEYARDWTIAGAAYRIETSASGDSCANANAAIVLRAPNGSEIFRASHPTAQVSLSFNPNADQAGLQTEIEGWSANVANGPTAADLAPWPAGEPRPPAFQPAVTRDVYEAARAASRPVFAYPDGGESNAYVAVDPSTQTAVLLGSWTPERP